MYDFKKDPLYKVAKEPHLVTVKPMLFVMVDGEGAPDGSSFQGAMEAIFSVVYTIKFWNKKHEAPAGFEPFTLPPIETTWWMTSGNEFSTKNKDDWHWTAMVRLPEFVTDKFFNEVVKELVVKKGSDVFERARLERWQEGLCVEALHVGPYDTVSMTIDAMLAYAKKEGYEPIGKHHELYMNDPRRTAPEKLRTILRHPIKK